MARGTTESSFDELASGLARGTLSRGKALRLMGAALLGGTLASLGIGEAAGNPPGCKPNGKHCKRDTQCCSGNCEGRVCQAGGGCPIGSTLCGGACVSNLCPAGQAFNPSTCQCGVCPPGTTICTSGTLPGLNACCPLETHIACCGGSILDPCHIVDPTCQEIDAHIIGCISTSCPGGCVIRATSPGDLLGGRTEVCVSENCHMCVTDSGRLGCLRRNPNGSIAIPPQCDPM
jgi:hypothetical protein